MGKRKAGADDGQTELDKLDELSHDLAFACNINDYAAATRVYDRFLSVLEPGGDLPLLDARQFPLTLGKRKTGAETAPCAMEILQELSHDMEAAVGQEDFTACDRIYDRFLAERKNGVVKMFTHSENVHTLLMKMFTRCTFKAIINHKKKQHRLPCWPH